MCRPCLFLWENWVESFRVDAKQSLYYISPAVFIFSLSYGLSYTTSYANERAVLVLLVNFVMTNVIFSLMLTNMAKRPFTLVQPAYIFLIVPLIAWAIDLYQEIYITRVCCVLAFCFFYMQVIIVSKQWLDYSGRTFFIASPQAVK